MPVAAVDEEVWEEFADDPQRLRTLAEAIRNNAGFVPALAAACVWWQLTLFALTPKTVTSTFGVGLPATNNGWVPRRAARQRSNCIGSSGLHPFRRAGCRPGIFLSNQS